MNQKKIKKNRFLIEEYSMKIVSSCANVNENCDANCFTYFPFCYNDKVTKMYEQKRKKNVECI